MSAGVSMPLPRRVADHRQAVELGQHAVDDQHVVLAVQRQREALLAVGREIGHVADLAEGLDQVVGGVAVVFDDQETHDGSAIFTVWDFPQRDALQSCEFIIAGTRRQVAERMDAPRGWLKRARGGGVSPTAPRQPRTGGGDGCRAGVG